jgi:glycosyltransferase involved in cell wall biosynthesis
MGTLRVAVIGRYPIRKDHIVGGVEAAIVYLTEELRRRPGFDVHVLTLRPEVRESQKVVKNGVTVHYLPASRHWGHITHHLLDRHRLVKALRQINPHLVHAHIAGEYAEAAHQSGYPYVLTLHGIRHREASLWERGLATGVRAFLISRSERACVRRARHIISISPYVTQEFRDLIRAKIYDIDNPVPQQFFDVRGHGHDGRLLFVGRPCLRKGFLHLLQALSLVEESHLHVAGPLDLDADYLCEINQVLKHADLAKRVRFLGSLDEKQLLEQYQESSIFVLPSVQETAAMALLQAMAAARAPVVTGVGGHGYLIEPGRTGLLVKPGDTADLAHAILQLLRDKHAQREMAENARQEALERFHASRVAERTVAVYQEVLDSPWPSRGNHE